MCEDKPYFADARVGDSVYDMAYGVGKVERIDNIMPYIIIHFANNKKFTFTTEGRLSCLMPQVIHQTLFYSKPIFELPPPPKRMVKKVIEGWIMIYPHCLRKSKEEAEYSAKAGSLDEAHFIRHEYEVEE